MLKKTPKSVFVIIGFLPLFVLLYSLYKYGVNAPHWDDHALRIFVDKYYLESNFLEKIKSIFAYHNEHRIALTRISSLAIFKSQGFLDFKTMQYIGFAGLVGIWLIFALLIKRFKIHPVFYFIAGLCIFSFSTVENLLWGMASIQNFWIVLLSFASFYILSFSLETKSKFQKNMAFYLALFFATAALFTSGNGILTPVLGLGILLFKREKTLMLIWSLTFLVFIILYFIGYSEIPSKVITLNMHVVKAFLMSIGSAFFFDEFAIGLSNGVLTLIGACISITAISLIFYPFLKAIHFKKQKPNGLLFLLAAGLFIAGTLAVVCINRIHFNESIILTSKYKLYSFLAILLLLIYAAYYAKKNLMSSISIVSLSIATILYIGTYLGYFKYFSLSKGKNEVFILNNYNSNGLPKTSYKPYPENLALGLNFRDATKDESKIDSIALGKKNITFFEFAELNASTDYFAIAKNDSNTSFIALNLQPQQRIIPRLFSYYDNNYSGSLNLLNFPNGIYQIFFLDKNENEQKLFNPNKTLRIRGVPYVEDAKNW
jgi:hypothetical protein